MKIKKSFLFVFLILFILFLLFFYSLAKSYSDSVFLNISNTFLRFHVVANSNSTEDQIIKYKVRDAIMNYISPLLKDVDSKDEACKIIGNNLKQIEEISSNIIMSENLNYPVHVTIGKSKFPTKDYNDFVLPEGTYDALKIELGNAYGQNWWCVMFPSICIPQYDDISLSQDYSTILQNALDSEELSIISNNSASTDIKIKFKLIELFENI